MIASSAIQTWVSLVRHVLNLHYIGGQSISVFVHNYLPVEHPLHRLLWPHVAGTLAVNWAASRNFVGPNKVGVFNYGPSWEGGKPQIPSGWAAFEWEDYDLPEIFGAEVRKNSSIRADTRTEKMPF